MQQSDDGKSHNCCVTFTDASPDLERQVGGRNNCCVKVGGGMGEKALERERQMRRMVVGVICFFIAVVGFTVVMSSGRRGGGVAVKGEGVVNVKLS